MFLKNSLSSDGVGVGVGGGDVCASRATAVASINSIMPKRHCDRLFLRMLIHLAGSGRYSILTQRRKALRVSKGFLCAFAPLRQKYFLPTIFDATSRTRRG